MHKLACSAITANLMKILVIKPSSLGDIIHALPFLHTIKESFPDSTVDWVISTPLKGILEGNPLINELILFNKDAWKNIKRFRKTLSEMSTLKKQLQLKHYTVVVDLQGLLRSGLIAFFTPAMKKIGFADAREGGRYFYNKKVAVRRDTHAVDKCLEAAKAVGANVKKVVFPVYITDTARSRVKTLLEEIDEYIILVPSARWETKRWPPEKFAALTKKISLPCIITGSTGDERMAGKIMDAASKQTINLAGKTGLKELAALIAGAQAVVSNDSGPMHIAAALDIPTVALFGPTDPLKTGPYGWQKNRKLNVITSDARCRPCRRKSCRDFICMDRIRVETVHRALTRIMK